LTAAQLLDELMGRDRNLVPGEKSTQVHWSHPDVCKHFLCGFCANDLFVNTKADLGPCTKIHDEVLKLEYEKSSRYGKMGFEEDFVRYLNTIQADVERKIRRGHERLQMNKQREQELAENDSDKTKMLTDHINQLLEEIEQLGGEGKVEEAQGVARLVEQLKEEREQSKAGSGIAGQEKQMEVCEVCGAFLIVGDAQARVDDHLQGKQHVGYAKIKSTIEDLKQKPWLKPKGSDRAGSEKKEERDKIRERERDRDQRSRSRRSSVDRHKERRRRSRSRSRDRYRDRRRSHERSERRDRDRSDRRRESRDRDRERERDRDRDRERERDRRDRDRDYKRSSRRSRSRSRDRSSSRRGRSRDRDEKRNSRQSSRDRDRDRRSSRERTNESEVRRSREKSETRDRAHKDEESPKQSQSSDSILNHETVGQNNKHSEDVDEYSNTLTQDYSSLSSHDLQNQPTQDYSSNQTEGFPTNKSLEDSISRSPMQDFTSDTVNEKNSNGDVNMLNLENSLDEYQNNSSRYQHNSLHTNDEENHDSRSEGEVTPSSTKEDFQPFSTDAMESAPFADY